MHRPLKILVLGGTEFLGRHFVTQAREKGHEVVLFNRGNTNPDLFKELRTIKGDRFKDMDKLTNEFEENYFDAIIDTNGYFPNNIDYITNSLRKITKTYLFVSTCSVFDLYHQAQERVTEEGNLVDLDIDPEDKTNTTYGARKYLCEQVIEKNFKDNYFIVRPGLIVGPYDPTYRFPYWADRVSEGGDVLAPGEKEAPVQFIDARDLSAFMLHGLERNLKGIYNTVSPYSSLTLGEFLETVKETINPKVNYKWVPESYLRDHEIGCWKTLPLWVYKEIQAFQKLDSQKAINAGLTFRDINETIKDTYLWSKDLYQEKYLHEVLSRKIECELLRNYNEYKNK